MIAEHKIAEVRQAARLSEFVSPYVALKRRGRALLGLCPFHSEKTPSFSVNDEAGFYHCFGCGAGGNVFKFLMQIENLAFPEAVRKVASQCGIDVPEEGRAAGTASERDAMLAVLASATRYFRACLTKEGVGDAAARYLAERGVDEAASERFALGATPLSGDGLARWLRRERLDLQAAERLGLVSVRGGTPTDRFRSRLMFPIRDPQGRTVGFGARRLGDGDGPKYLNSSDSLVYRKGRVLYGLFEAREQARRRAQAEREAAAEDGGGREEEWILVEGYLDAIALAQAGIVNVVAGCGTALTVDQARLLRRYGGEVIALYDGDDAGRRAAARSFPIFLEAGLWARGAFLPDGEDPDTFVRAHGAGALRAQLEKAPPLVESYVRDLASSRGGGGGDVARVGAELADALAKVENPFEYDAMVKKASLWTGISEEVLRDQARRRTHAAPRTASPRPRATLRSGPPSAEELVATILVADPKVVDRLEGRDIVSGLREEPWATIVADIVAAHAAPGGFDAAELLEGLDEAVRDRIASRLADDPTFESDSDRERLWADALEHLAAAARKERTRRMQEELRRLEDRGDEAAAAALLAEIAKSRNAR